MAIIPIKCELKRVKEVNEMKKFDEAAFYIKNVSRDNFAVDNGDIYIFRQSSGCWIKASDEKCAVALNRLLTSKERASLGTNDVSVGFHTLRHTFATRAVETVWIYWCYPRF